MKDKPKGTPIPARQNILYLAVGLIIGAIVAGAAVVVLLPAITPQATATATPAAPAPTASPVFAQAVPQATIIAPRIQAVAVAPDGQRMATASWDMGQGSITLHTFNVPGNLVGQSSPLGTQTPFIDRLVFSPDGTRLAAMTQDSVSTVILYDVTSRQELHRFDGYGRAAFSPDGEWLVLGGKTSGLRLLSALTLDLVATAPAEHTLERLAFSPDSQTIAAAYYNMADNSNYVALLNAQDLSAAPVKYGEGTLEYVTDLAFHPSGDLLAVATLVNVRVYDLKNSGQRYFPLDELGHVNAVRFSPDGSWLAAAGGSMGAGIRAAIYLWHWDESAILDPNAPYVEASVLTGHDHDVNDMAFIAGNPPMLLSASSDGSLRLWNVTNGAEVSRMQI